MQLTPATAVTIGAVAAGAGAGFWAGTRLVEPKVRGKATGLTGAAAVFGVMSVGSAYAGLLQVGMGSARVGAAMVAPAIGTLIGAAVNKPRP